ncbi:MAG: ArgK/MeaB family GTPase, partial [Candidatus Hodarchaeales archaeon]
GNLGGLALATSDAVKIMDAAGKDIIIIETVGAGQSEIEIVHDAHTSVVLTVPGLGDDIQTIKAGIMEIADIFVINKSDLDGADRTYTNLSMMLEMESDHFQGRWYPPIVNTVAKTDKGIDDLLEKIREHRKWLQTSGQLYIKKREIIRNEITNIMKNRIQARIAERENLRGLFDDLVEKVMAKKTNPYAAAQLILRSDDMEF